MPRAAGAGGSPEAGERTPPSVFGRLHNTTRRRLHCVMLDLTDRFRIHVDLFPGAFIDPGQVGAAAEGQPVAMALPPGRPARPGTSVQDWLTLIVSEDEANSRLRGLPALGEPAGRQQGNPVAVMSIVERLGLTATDRDAVMAAASAGEWWTVFVSVVTQASARGDYAS